MSVQDNGHYAAAVTALAQRSFETAGNAYTRAAWQVLADPRPDTDPFEIDPQGWIGIGLEYLTVGTLSYRVAGREQRARQRAVEAIAIATDFENLAERPVQQACFQEFKGDLRVVGGLSDHAAAYRTAAKTYHNALPDDIDPQRWATTPLFEAAAGPLKQAARTLAEGEIAVTWSELHGDDPEQPGAFLAARPQYKRQRFPEIVAQTIDTGTLAAPRGSTEYDTNHHQCPACGSTDVNWVADSTLCLRCSRPTAPQ